MPSRAATFATKSIDLGGGARAQRNPQKNAARGERRIGRSGDG
jgi:hypothetical protein